MAAETLPVHAFRDSVGEFATGVTVVIAERDGEVAGMTLNSFTSVSLDPLLILVSLGHGSRTLWMVNETGRFTVSVLHRAQREIAMAFALPGAPFAREHATRAYDGSLVVAGAASTHSCEVEQVVRAGDHDLVLGRVVGITHAGGEPLVFHRGRFGGLEPDVAVPPGVRISLDEGAGW